MENDLVHDDGPNGNSPLGEEVRSSRIIANTATAIQKARAAGVLVGYVRVAFRLRGVPALSYAEIDVSHVPFASQRSIMRSPVKSKASIRGASHPRSISRARANLAPIDVGRSVQQYD
jgi:nicotinamidase-related amidase